MLAGLDAKFVAMNVNGPPNEPVVIFCRVNVAGLGVLVKVHMIFAKSFKLTAGTVITLPANEPKLAGFPLVPAFVSVHVPVERVKFAFAASVKVTGLALLETVLLMTVVGAATPAAVVVIFGGRPVKLVAVKLKGPPAKAVVIFCIATTGMAGLTVLVIVQVICALARILMAGIVTNVPANDPNVPAGLPEAAALLSTQLAAVRVKFVTAGSVIMTAVPLVVATIGAGTAG